MAAAAGGRRARPGSRYLFQPALLGLLALVIGAGTFWYRSGETGLSAAEVAARVNRLDALLSPGEVLHRVVRTTFQTRPVLVTTVHEWLDATGTRSAAQGYAEDGRLLWTQVTRADGEDAGSQMYLLPDPAARPEGLLVVRPGARELREALGSMPGAVRAKLQPILNRRGVVPEPIWSDRWENRVMLGVETREPRREETLDASAWTTPSGTRGYRLRAVDGWRPWVEWRGEGITGLPARFERVRYIDGTSYLTLRETAEYRLDDGRVFGYERQATTSERLTMDAAAEARFRLEIPEGTPVRRASAAEELRALADAVRKKP